MRHRGQESRGVKKSAKPRKYNVVPADLAALATAGRFGHCYAVVVFAKARPDNLAQRYVIVETCSKKHAIERALGSETWEAPYVYEHYQRGLWRPVKFSREKKEKQL